MLRGTGAYLRRHHVALLALFLALGGTSFAAATLIDGSQIKPNSIPRNRLTKSAIASLHGAKGREGTPGPQGPRGVTGTPGATGPHGQAGQRGPTGRAGLLGSLGDIEGLRCTGGGTTALFYFGGGDSNPKDAGTGSGQWQTIVVCLVDDDLEPNNTKATATDATDFVDADGGRWAQATVYPSHDDDWYKLVDTDLGGGSLIVLYTGRGVDTVMDVYEDANPAPVATGVFAYEPEDGEHTWYVHVYSQSARLDLYYLAFNDSGFRADGRPRSASLASRMPTFLRVHQ